MRVYPPKTEEVKKLYQRIVERLKQSPATTLELSHDLNLPRRTVLSWLSDYSRNEACPITRVGYGLYALADAEGRVERVWR